MWIHLTLCSVTLVLCERIHGLDPISEEEPSRTFLYRRAVDGTRGSKYYDPDEDSFDIYNPYDDETDLSGYRSNVPGEPGIDYPSYTRIPQTSFTCESQFRGYYADEEAGCQLFHVCDGNFLVSSFLCPIGSTFSQQLLTCDWWNKVDCSITKNFYQTVSQRVSEVDDDEYLRKAYEMTSLQTADNGVSVNPRNQIDNSNSNSNDADDHLNDLQGPERYSDYQNTPSRSSHSQFKYSSRYSGSPSYNRNLNSYSDDTNDKLSIRIHTIGQDKKDYDEDQYNRHQPAYAPTVPTVTTTTRRFYSPTIPTVIKPTTKYRYDLELESSDHLYSAKGKSRTTTSRPTSRYSPSTTERIKLRSTTVSSTSRILSSTLRTPPSTLRAPPSPSRIPSSTPKVLLSTSKITPPTSKISFSTLRITPSTPRITSSTPRISPSTLNSLSSTTERISYFSVTPIHVREESFVDEPNSVSKEVLNTSDDSNIIQLSLIKSSDSEQVLDSSEKTDIIPESPIINVLPYSNESDSQYSINSSWPNEVNNIIPAISFLPPYYYYSDIDQHESVSLTKSEEFDINSTSLEEESTTSWYDKSAFSVPSVNIVPPIRDRVEEELQSSTLNSINDFPYEIGNLSVTDITNINRITISPGQQTNSPVIHSLFDFENTTYPTDNYEYEVDNRDEVQLSVTDDTLETSTSFNYLKDYFDKKKKELLGDLIGGESSPVQVTLTVKNDEDLDPSGEFIRSLIAQHDPISAGQFQDIEIIKSQAPKSGKDSEIFQKATKIVINQYSDKNKSKVKNYDTNSSKIRQPLRPINNTNDDIVPRPFSINNEDVQVTLPSTVINELYRETSSTTYSPLRTKNQKPQTKENSLPVAESHSGFDLPSQERHVDFQSQKLTFQETENDKQKINNQKNWNVTKTRVIVETELVPSLGFSLNTNEERAEFANAVKRGLLNSASASNINATSNIESYSKS